MASSSPISRNRYHFRSISMPLRSHPNTNKIEEVILKLKTCESSSTLKSQTICIRLAGLGELYNCLEDLLQLPLTQQALLKQQEEKWVDDVLDGSIILLDVCGGARDVLLQMKEHAQDLRSALRRWPVGECCMEKKVSSYIRFRKKMKKDISKYLGELKRMDSKCFFPPPLNQDYHLEMVTRVLRQVRVITISIFQSLMSFMSEPMSKPKPSSRWSLVSKLMQKGKVECEGKHEDIGEVECVDVAVHTLSQHILSKDAEVEWAQEGLEGLVSCVEGLEIGLECVFRRLIQTRVSLLNIFTNWVPTL